MTNRIYLRIPAREAILEAGRRAATVETGGILVGYRIESGIIVTRALEVQNSRATSSSYRSDHELAEAELARDKESHPADFKSGYVGEWHTHPAQIGPSWRDHLTMSMLRPRADGPIALVVCHPGSSTFWGQIPWFVPTSRLAPVESLFSRLESWLGPLPAGGVRSDGPVFISYRQSDGTAAADDIERLLRAAGIVVWRDQRDLRPGTTEDRLELALTTGLSGAVLVVTPDIVNSDIVRNREAPRLIQLDRDPDFSLAIANYIPGANPDKVYYGAPDRLLGLEDEGALRAKKQSNGRNDAGLEQIARDLLLHRMEIRRPLIMARDGELDLFVQTRPEPSAMDADIDADLHIRIPAPEDGGKVPSRESVAALSRGLPLASDAAYASGARSLAVFGGAHLSIALAIGAAFPETKFQRAKVHGREQALWTNDLGGPARAFDDLEIDVGDVTTEGAPIAVLVTLAPAPDTAGFQRYVADGDFSAARHLALFGEAFLDPAEGGDLAVRIASTLKSTARDHRTTKVHLAFQGPFPMAVLLGRLLNTLRTTVLEWDDVSAPPRYVPIATLMLGTSNSPIVEVLL